MATRQNFLLFDSSTDANFRSWGSGINAALAAMGWTQTTDTGQINWTTVTTPAVSTFAGYEVWKWSDTNQSACPVYMRVDYGNNSNATKGPAIKVQIATGSDGAGNLTGNTTTAISLIATSNSLAGQGSINTYECNFSSAAGRFCMMLWRTAPVTAPVFLSVERSCDSTGAYTASYVTVTMAGGVGAGCNQWTLMAQGTGGVFRVNNNTDSLSTTGAICCAATGAATSSTTFGSKTCFSPVFPLVGQIDNPCRAVGVVKTGDQAEGATFTVNLYGVSHTFLYSKVSNFNTYGAANSNQGLCMRWD